MANVHERISYANQYMGCLDDGSISQLQIVHPENRQIWHEVWYCEGYTSTRVVRATKILA